MKMKHDPRFWGLIGFGVGAVLASGGSLNSPIDSIFGGLIQAAIWFLISRYFIRRNERKANLRETNGLEVTGFRTLLLFDRPLSRDWLFYVFGVILAANIVNGLSNVMESGGFTLDSFGLVSGLLDGAFRVIFAWFPLVPIIYFIRKFIRKRRTQTT